MNEGENCRNCCHHLVVLYIHGCSDNSCAFPICQCKAGYRTKNNFVINTEMRGQERILDKYGSMHQLMILYKILCIPGNNHTLNKHQFWFSICF